MMIYRDKLAAIEAGLGRGPAEDVRWTADHRAEWFILDWNAKRLAVLDRDVDAVIRTTPGTAVSRSGTSTRPGR